MKKQIPLSPPEGVQLSTVATSEPPKVGDLNTAPTTTAADDLMTASQRRVNLTWEITQSLMALTITGATLWVAGSIALSKNTDRESAFLLLSNTFFLVVSVYIQRTNHQKIGGVQRGDAGR